VHQQRKCCIKINLVLSNLLLGENVKQANWGITNPTRFPQTRMGVEQVFTDYFQRAKRL
jgi:hypothetical protein